MNGRQRNTYITRLWNKRMLEMVKAQVKSNELLFVKQITATLAINTGPGLVGIAALLDP